jgi:hypothetical protein
MNSNERAVVSLTTSFVTGTLLYFKEVVPYGEVFVFTGLLLMAILLSYSHLALYSPNSK